jgi:hypothetical protein
MGDGLWVIEAGNGLWVIGYGKNGKQKRKPRGGEIEITTPW